jgi:tight adherence protein C
MNIFMLYLPAVCVVGGIAMIWRMVAVTDQISVQELQHLDELDDPTNTLRRVGLQKSMNDRVLGPMAHAISERIRQVTPVGRLEAIQHKLVLAGMDGGKVSAEAVLGAKLVATVIGGFIGVLMLSSGITTGSIFRAGLAVGVAYLVPETLLKRRVEDRQKQIEYALPDTIDQITVTVEAGLSFDGAIQRAGEESSGPLAEEFLKVVNDMQIGMTREEALESLLLRTDVPSLRGFVLSIRQASRYGLPIARVLRVQANEMREKRRAKAEEKAMQIPVKITFPLVFCILPALFLVILGPAGIQITQNFG